MKEKKNTYIRVLFTAFFLYSCETISDVTDYVSSGFSSDENENVEIVTQDDGVLDSDSENIEPEKKEVQDTEEKPEKTETKTKNGNKNNLETTDEKLSPTPQQEYESALISENSEENVVQKKPTKKKSTINFEAVPLSLDNKIQYRIATIAFGSGSSSVNSLGLRKIKKIVEIAKKRNARVKIVGHASSRTKDMTILEHKLVNFRISDQRAQSVARVFIQNKFPSERLIAEAVSDAKPLFQENMPAGTTANQRTEIFLIY